MEISDCVSFWFQGNVWEQVLRVPFILEMISAVPFMITVSGRKWMTTWHLIHTCMHADVLSPPLITIWQILAHLGQSQQDTQAADTLRHPPANATDSMWEEWQSEDEGFIILTGDFTGLQKPLHPGISQLLVGQTLVGKHDCKWGTINLSFSLTFANMSLCFCCCTTSFSLGCFN